MARPTEESINVSAIKLTDPYVKEIVDTAAHVVIYIFKWETGSWEKTNVEGALFIYRRNSLPKYNAFVLNRLSTQNLVEPIDENFDIQLDEPYLLYKNSNGGIHCVWFYNPCECNRIAKSVELLVSELRKEKVKMGSPMKNEETNRRVLDFIALASSTPQANSRPKPQHPQLSPAFRTEFSDNALLQRLMSANQPLSVQDIEKQHNVRRSLKDENSKVPLCLPLTPQGKIENGLNYLRISESPPKVSLSSISSIPSQQFYNSNISPSSTEQPVEVSALERSVTCSTIGMETPTKPALLPPTVFATTPKEDNYVIPEPLTKTQLLQAVSYLLKNDADFVKKLHEAYVKSFVDMVS